MKAISTGIFGRVHRNEIVTAMHTRILQYKDFPVSFEYKKAYERLVQKYPSLVDKSLTGYVSCFNIIAKLKYSKVSVSGPSMKGTLYVNPLYTQGMLRKYNLPVSLVRRLGQANLIYCFSSAPAYPPALPLQRSLLAVTEATPPSKCC